MSFSIDGSTKRISSTNDPSDEFEESHLHAVEITEPRVSISPVTNQEHGGNYTLQNRGDLTTGVSQKLLESIGTLLSARQVCALTFLLLGKCCAVLSSLAGRYGKLAGGSTQSPDLVSARINTPTYGQTQGDERRESEVTCS
jgi:hypothetical protein